MGKEFRRAAAAVLAVAAAASALASNDSDAAVSDRLSRELFSLLPIVPTFTDKVRSERCRNDSRVFREQLANFRLWAVKMLDASTKMPDGILEGNTFQLGHFDECLSINVALPGAERRLRGQYCLAEIEYSPRNMEEPPRSEEIDLFNASAWLHISSFNLDRTKTRRDEIFWSLCVPDSCGPEDVKQAMDDAFRESSLSLGLDVAVKVGDKFCQVAAEPFDFSWIGIPQLALGGVACLFGALVIFSTTYDMMSIEDKRIKGSWAKFLDCFSAKANFRNLRRVDETRDIIPIHTARFASMIVILMGHRFIANSGAPIHNAAFMENAVGNPLFIHLLMGPILVVDTFFLLSGFLTANQMLRDFDTRRFRLVSGYVHRYVRLTPVYMIVVFFYATFFYHLGSGPLWKARVTIEQQRCASNWWTNLAYVNNYINTENLCMFQSWHLTCDFHFYLMAPPIVYLLWKKAALGLAFIAALIVGVMAALFMLTFNHELDPVLMSFNSVMVDLSSDPTFRVTYIPTHTRFIPYLMGMVTSFIYYKRKLHRQLSARQKMCCAAAAFAAAHIPIITAIFFYSPEYEYNKFQAALYAALHRLPWCAAIGWLILSAGTGNAGILQGALSWKAFVPLSRLTYCVFLSHGAIQLYTASTLRTAEYNSKFKVLWTLMGDVLVTYIVALVMHVLFEAPILKLDRTYLTPASKPRENAKPELSGEANQGYSADSIPNLSVISNDQTIYSITNQPHDKYSNRYEKYHRRESDARGSNAAFEIR